MIYADSNDEQTRHVLLDKEPDGGALLMLGTGNAVLGGMILKRAQLTELRDKLTAHLDAAAPPPAPKATPK